MRARGAATDAGLSQEADETEPIDTTEQEALISRLEAQNVRFGCQTYP